MSTFTTRAQFLPEGELPVKLMLPETILSTPSGDRTSGLRDFREQIIEAVDFAVPVLKAAPQIFEGAQQARKIADSPVTPLIIVGVAAIILFGVLG